MGSIPIRPAGMVFGVRSETRNHMRIGTYMVLVLVPVLVLVSAMARLVMPARLGCGKTARFGEKGSRIVWNSKA